MEQVDIERDVVFHDAGGRPLKLDIYQPRGARNGAAVLLLHGGGWSRGSKDMLAPHATALAEQGFVAVASEYRLTGEARFPAQIHDAKRAIRWVRGHAGELGFDPDRLCLEGHSAGAHLALLAAGTPDDARLDPPEGSGGVSAAVAAVAAIYPPVLFHIGETRPSGGLAARSLPGADDSEEAARLASPIEHVSARLPPVMLLHGDADKVVPVSASRRYEERVRAAGGKVDLHIFAGLPHGFGNHEQFRPMMMAMIGGFFRRTVADPQAFAFGPPPAQRAATPVPA
ncbi:MAG TPA: alpha/beta hydrolase [Caulobacteraceae bacterium]|jgi:acetyl esterase/lipase|nr:alpha/beta hydrolase [Caulobacteraceae bacterium]